MTSTSLVSMTCYSVLLQIVLMSFRELRHVSLLLRNGPRTCAVGRRLVAGESEESKALLQSLTQLLELNATTLRCLLGR